MANYSDQTRKEQVLARLRAANGLWVDGPEIANERVGGSEGLRRLRELADEGHEIRKRKHPDPARDIYQYRLVPRAAADPAPEDAAEILLDLGKQVEALPPIEPAEKPEYPKSPWPADSSQTPIREAIKRKEDGTYEYVPPQRPIHAPEQLSALPEEPQPAGQKFEELPRHVDWGAVAVCPRCKSKTTRGREPKKVDVSTLTPQQRRQRERKKVKEDLKPMIDAQGVKLFKDPHAKPTQPCTRCNGYGIVPNVGPIPFTPPAPPEETQPVEAPTTEAFPDA